MEAAMSAAVEEEEPKDAKLVKSILDLMGVQKYEPRAVNQFMDLWYRYVVDVLGDAQLYSEHAGKQVIDCEEVKLAIQSRANFSFMQPPSRETLLDLAKVRNSTALLKTIGGPGSQAALSQLIRKSLIKMAGKFHFPLVRSGQGVSCPAAEKKKQTNWRRRASSA